MRLVLADTSAYAWRTLIRSFCMSSTACVSTFSGSSMLLSAWFTFDFTSRTKRSPMFISQLPTRSSWLPGRDETKQAGREETSPWSRYASLVAAPRRSVSVVFIGRTRDARAWWAPSLGVACPGVGDMDGTACVQSTTQSAS